MKMVVTIALTFVLAISSIARSNAANPVTGAKCAKVGKVEIYKNSKFTCIKSGKKLVWNKGVRIINLKASSTPLKSSLPTMAATPTPTQSNSSAKTANEKLQIEFESVSKESYRLIRENWPKQREKLSIEYHFTDNFPKDILNAWKIQATSSVDFYEQLVDTKQVFNIYFVTEKDQSWVEQLGFWNPENFTFFQYWNEGHETNNCEGVAAWFLTAKGSESPQLHGGISVSSIATLKGMLPWCQHVLSHEMFHAVQDYWFTQKQGSAGFPSRDAYDLVEMPIFREGSADTVASAIGEPTYEKYLAAFKDRFGELLRNHVPKLRAIDSEQELVSYMKEIEFRSNSDEAHEASYFVGMMMFEFAIWKYGFAKYEELLKLQNRNTSFRDVFKSVYGFSIDEMYRQSASHILIAKRLLTSN